MNCDQGSRIIIVPAGCLGHREIDLQCKSPLERVYYQFSMVNRLSPSDAISCVSAQPSDETLSVDRITVSGQTFRARISGGTMNTKTGIRFLVTTRANEEREFVVTLPIMPEGIMGSGEAGNYVLGDTGPQGPQGCAATVTVGKVLPTEPDGDPKIVNSGTEVDAVLDFTLPRGQVGPQGERGQAATVKIGNVVTGAAGSDAAVENRGDGHNAVLDFTIPEGRQGIQGIQGKAGTQILLSNRDPIARDAKENIVWLNDVTGDLFETVSRGGDAYSWHKSGNLKGEAGSIIYTGTVDPVYNEVYKKSDLYFNITNSNLFTFNDNQWVRLANLKGDQGERGSLWFFAQEDPVTSSSYRIGDSFLNTASNDLFVFNGTNWQKVGNLQGKQGDTGPQGLQGDTGPQGLQGIQGEKGEAGKDGRDGFDGTRIITSQQDPDQGSAPLNPNVVWINTTSWEVKRTIPHGDSWDWVSLGSIRGPCGDTGPQGLQGLQGEKGAKGDDGSRWYSGHNLPDATIGLNDPRGMPRAGDQYLYLDEKTGEASAYIYTNDKTWGGPLGKVAGPQGKAATVRAVEQVRPLRPDEAATIKNIGDEHDAILQFSIPKGEKGDVGPIGKEGAAATIRIGTVTTTDPDVQASVRNSGSENTAVLEFSIPKGEKGDSYTNDGSTELNVKSIQSDGGKVGTDGAGKLSAEMLDYTIKVPTPSHQDASLGKVVDLAHQAIPNIERNHPNGVAGLDARGQLTQPINNPFIITQSINPDAKVSIYLDDDVHAYADKTLFDIYTVGAQSKMIAFAPSKGTAGILASARADKIEELKGYIFAGGACWLPDCQPLEFKGYQGSYTFVCYGSDMDKSGYKIKTDIICENQLVDGKGEAFKKDAVITIRVGDVVTLMAQWMDQNRTYYYVKRSRSAGLLSNLYLSEKEQPKTITSLGYQDEIRFGKDGIFWCSKEGGEGQAEWSLYPSHAAMKKDHAGKFTYPYVTPTTKDKLPVDYPIGTQSYDTDKKEPLWWNGTEWIDPVAKAATIKIGNIVSVEADQPAQITNSGSDINAVFDFSIPKGEKGQQGISVESVIMNDDLTFSFMMSNGSIEKVYSGLYRNKDGVVIAPEKVSEIPNDFSLNGNLYIASDDYLNGSKKMPEGLSLNGNIVLTDGSVYYKNSWNNGGVLCVA